jgi:DNA polymerase-3 subunit alpha
MLKTFEMTIDYYSNRLKTNVPGQLNLFDEIPTVEEKTLPYITKNTDSENSSKVCLKMEKEVMGVYLSSHPLKQYEENIKRIADTYSYEILNSSDGDSRLSDGSFVTMVGIIQNKNIRTTRKGQQMAVFQLEDLYGSVNVIAFPKKFAELSLFISDDNIVVLKGSVIINEDEEPKISMVDASLFNTNAVSQKLYIKIENTEVIDKVKEILKEHSGNTPVYVYFSKEKKNTIAEKSMWVTLSKTLMTRLRELLGSENIVIV